MTSSLRGSSAELLLARIAPRLPAVVTWTLGILLGVQAALIVRDLIPQPAPVVTIPPAAEGAVRRAVNVQGILNAHLFGVAEAGEGATDPADAPQTSLTLVLAGTIASSDPKQGLGIIGETAQTGKVYSVGDNVAGGGAKLHAVYPDRVILDRNGQLEALMLPRKLEGGAAGIRTSSVTPDRGDGAPGGNQFADRVRRMIAQDPGSVAEVMRPQPVFANGVQRGYRVYPGRNRQAFARLGLRPGDLVMAINGTPLDDPARGMEIFRSIGSAESVRVIIERSGRPQELTLNMAQLANQAQELAEGSADPMVPMDQQPPMPEPPIEQ